MQIAAGRLAMAAVDARVHWPMPLLDDVLAPPSQRGSRPSEPDSSSIRGIDRNMSGEEEAVTPGLSH